jgi:hypothetical protein
VARGGIEADQPAAGGAQPEEARGVFSNGIDLPDGGARREAVPAEPVADLAVPPYLGDQVEVAVPRAYPDAAFAVLREGQYLGTAQARGVGGIGSEVRKSFGAGVEHVDAAAQRARPEAAGPVAEQGMLE